MSAQAEPKSPQPAHGVVRDQTHRTAASAAVANMELVESLHQFITIWRLIGKPFPQVDSTDRLGLAISWPNTSFPFDNSLFLTEQLTDARVLQDRVQEAAAYMRARPYGGCLSCGWTI
jgi:hypothetical protein